MQPFNGPCLPHADAVKKLTTEYKEQQIGIGLRGPTQLYELFVSEEGTWTILKTEPNGRTCIMASGDNWETAPLVTGVEG